MKVALDVPVLPSVTVTSLIERPAVASSSVIVPTPWPSAIVALTGAAQVDEERLVDLVEQVAAAPATVMVCVVWPGAKVTGVAGTAV